MQLGVEDHPSGPGATGQEKQAGGDEGARGGRGDLDRAPRRTDAHDPGEELPDVVADEQGHPRVYIPASMSSIAARSSSEGWTNRGDGHVDIVKALLVTCGHNDTPVRSTASRTTERSPSTGTRSTGRARISVRARSRPASSTSPIDGGIVGTMSTSLSGPSPPRHALEDHEVCCAVSSRRATGGGRAPACGHRSGGVGRDALGQSPRAAGPVIARC